jgi:hypothetical protein
MSEVEQDYSHEDGEIAEEAMDSVSVAPTARADRIVQDIAPNENAAKRAHNTIAHSGHIIHPSKSQWTAPALESSRSNDTPPIASTFGEMKPQGKQMRTTSAFTTDKIGDEARFIDGLNPYSPIGGARMSYDISDTNAEDDEGFFHPTVDYNSNAKGKGKGKAKGKAKGKSKNKGPRKDPDYLVIPPFGAAVAPYSIVFYPSAASTAMKILTQ